MRRRPTPTLPAEPYACRVFYLPLIGGPNTGDYLIPGRTTTPDSNPDNNADTTPIRLLATCVNPFGTGAIAFCPSGQAYVGPNDKPINNTVTFVAECCVSTTVSSNWHYGYGLNFTDLEDVWAAWETWSQQVIAHVYAVTVRSAARQHVHVSVRYCCCCCCCVQGPIDVAISKAVGTSTVLIGAIATYTVTM